MSFSEAAPMLTVQSPQSFPNGSDLPLGIPNSRLNVCPSSALVDKAGFLYKDDFRIVVRIDVGPHPEIADFRNRTPAHWQSLPRILSAVKSLGRNFLTQDTGISSSVSQIRCSRTLKRKLCSHRLSSSAVFRHISSNVFPSFSFPNFSASWGFQGECAGKFRVPPQLRHRS